MEENKSGVYIVSIIALVAIIAILILTIGKNTTKLSTTNSQNPLGQAAIGIEQIIQPTGSCCSRCDTFCGGSKNISSCGISGGKCSCTCDKGVLNS